MRSLGSSHVGVRPTRRRGSSAPLPVWGRASPCRQPPGRMDRRCHHHAGVQINRMLRLESSKWLEPSFIRAIFASGDRVGLVQSSVRKLLALPLAIQSDQIVDRRRLDATLFGHPRQHLSIGFSPLSRRTIACNAALASIVEPSTPIRSPLHQDRARRPGQGPSRTLSS